MTPSFELWLTLGALTGVLLAGIIPAVYLYVHFALILLLSTQQMFARRGDRASLAIVDATPTWGDRLQLHAAYPDRALARDIPYRVERVPLLTFIVLGFVLGART